MVDLKLGFRLKEICESTGIKYSTLRERVKDSKVKPLYVVSKSSGPGTGKGNLYDLGEVMRLFRPEERGRPRILKKTRCK